jgi:bifunctional UDP-N-acetylglucosamine pyrophosphorylase/glucosamine-1-phosphate N-acetyltransferase
VRKNPTTIGKRVFVGSGTELIAPVKVGDGAYIAAGSTITEDVPGNALGIARSRQETRPGWAALRRAEMAATAKPRKKSRSRSKSKRRRKPRPARRR